MSHGWSALSRYEKAALVLLVATVVVLANLGSTIAIFALPLLAPGIWVLVLRAQRMLQPGRGDAPRGPHG